MDFIINSLRTDWQAFLAYSPRLLYAAIVLVVFAIAARVFGHLVGRVMRRSERLRPNERYVRRLLTWTVRVVGVMAALGVMGFEGIAASLLATGGVVAIVLGFAFREIGENLLAGLFLAFSRPFEVGDLIKTGGLTGTVRAIDIRSVHIRTFDACDVFVPSAQIFRVELYNYTRDGLRRPSFTVGVAYHDEPDVVIDLLERTVRDTGDVLPEPAARVQISNFAASHIEYEVLFWADLNTSRRDLLSLCNDVKIRCWRALQEADMTFSTDVSTALDIKTLPPVALES
ncbi:mechanosensitive ion channel family protein [Elongatibacter sediminis]|uniref:Small-conductance mechanosensitive channel n=1 Tax=Elongatibacter sediminis TaxID=3119006 RepID=A0AAW9RB90_9GAMM